jgi:hypothetical protein
MKRLFAGLAMLTLAAAALPASADLSASDNSVVNYTTNFLVGLYLNHSNNANIRNTINTRSRTGGNAIIADDTIERSGIVTGDADALTDVGNRANSTDVTAGIDVTLPATPDASATDTSDLTLEQDETLEVVSNTTDNADVENLLDTSADSGNNMLSAGDEVADSWIFSGSGRAYSVVNNVLNSVRENISITRRLAP